MSTSYRVSGADGRLIDEYPHLDDVRAFKARILSNLDAGLISAERFEIHALDDDGSPLGKPEHWTPPTTE